MKELSIGSVLIEHRHKRGITQDELAGFMGVSKASVSKWETGTTYPDITLLPRLASFFNISIDQLMGYEPQMNGKEIRSLYRQLCAAFSTLPFDQVMEQCREIVKKYYSCPPLLFQIGSLYVNHSMLPGSPEKSAETLEEAEALFRRVRKESDNPELAKQAQNMEAYCLLLLGRAEEAIRLLEPLEMSMTSPEPVLALAYQSVGNINDARKILQAGIYSSVLHLLNHLCTYLTLCGEDKNAFEITCARLFGIADAFRIKTLHPGQLLTLYFHAAQGFMAFGNTEKVLELLEKYTELAAGDIYPLKLHGDSYFNRLDDWFETVLPLGSDFPRDERIIRKSMTEAVTDNPVFRPIADNPRFRSIVRKLREMTPKEDSSAGKQGNCTAETQHPGPGLRETDT